MRMHRMALAAGALVLGLALPTLAGPERIVFPKDYASAYVPLGAVDRYDSKMIRSVFINPEAYKSYQAGKPLPDGTVLVLEQRPAKLGADGQPELDAQGRFQPGGAPGFIGMQAKKAGWGADVPAALRNGDWEYAAFKPDGTLNPAVKLEPCFGCHQPRGAEDHTFIGWRVMNDLRAAGK
ncbi:cytochrome P460 family protein [Desertibaculum subflavum]|uniref:cytochrome P460 family protein n=1 Tax=Desertibaculum subflavum TaxID=2268458 RepID=UPI000E6648A4